MFYRATLNPTSKHDKDITTKNSYRPISHLNIDTIILNMLLVNQIWQCIKREYLLHQGRGAVYPWLNLFLSVFPGILSRNTSTGIPGKQSSFNISKSVNAIHYFNRIKGENHMIISVDAARTYDKNQHLFMIKTIRKLGIKRNSWIPLNRSRKIIWYNLTKILSKNIGQKAFTKWREEDFLNLSKVIAKDTGGLHQTPWWKAGMTWRCLLAFI